MKRCIRLVIDPSLYLQISIRVSPDSDATTYRKLLICGAVQFSGKLRSLTSGHKRTPGSSLELPTSGDVAGLPWHAIFTATLILATASSVLAYAVNVRNGVAVSVLVGVTVDVKVGVCEGVSVGVDEGVSVVVGVRVNVGPNNCPGPQPEIKKLTVSNKRSAG
jgi:hypothetical protein